MKINLQQIQARDPEAFKAAVIEYTPQLLRAGMGLGFPADQAQELVQQLWVTFFDVAPQFRGDSTLRTFLFGILYKKAMELRKKSKRFDTDTTVEEAMESRFLDDGHWRTRPLDPEAFSLSIETQGRINDCIGELPLKWKTAFLLKEVEGASTEEICNILGVTVTHLGVLFFRARNSLRECIERKQSVL